MTAAHLVRRVAPVAGVAVVAWLTVHAIAQGRFEPATIDWPLATLALVLAAAGNLATAALMLSRYRRHGSTVARAVLLRAYFLGQIAKYVPGKVAGLWYQAATLQQAGAAHVALTSNVDVMLIGMVANASGGVALLLLPRAPWAAATAVVAGALACVAVGTLRWPASLAARVMRGLGSHVPVPDFAAPGTVPAIVAYYVANLLVVVPSLVLVLVAATRVDGTTALELTGLSLLAWVAGAAAFVFPAGVGVREAAFIGMGRLTGTPVDLAGLAEAAVLLRLFQVAQDVACAAVFALLDRRRSAAERMGNEAR